jgi:hypothetical protein
VKVEKQHSRTFAVTFTSVIVLLLNGAAAADQSISNNASVSAVPFRVVLEDGAQGTIAIQVKQRSGSVVAKLDGTQPGSLTLDLSTLETGAYCLFASSPGYATWFTWFDITNGTANVRADDITLFRKRYAILHYSVNTAGKRTLTGPDVEQGRYAVAQWGLIPHFNPDWQITQGKAGLFLNFHRYTSAHGFARPPDGVSFEQLVEAPTDDAYKCEGFPFPATSGLVLFCHVHGNSPKDECYGKLFVEGITEQPPPDLKVLDAIQ